MVVDAIELLNALPFFVFRVEVIGDGPSFTVRAFAAGDVRWRVKITSEQTALPIADIARIVMSARHA